MSAFRHYSSRARPYKLSAGNSTALWWQTSSNWALLVPSLDLVQTECLRQMWLAC